MRLARDQAEAQASRLKARLEELFGQSGADITTAGAGGAPARRALAGSTSSAVMSAREAELMSTVANLKTALEKATASSVPTTKYMAVRGGSDAGRTAFALMTDIPGWAKELPLPR